MGLFSSTPKVPNTITDKQMRDLQRRGGKANNWFSNQAVARRKASELQRSKSRWS